MNLIVRASEETFRTAVFGTLEGKREVRPLGGPISRRPVLPGPAAPPCAALTRPARDMSGFWTRQVPIVCLMSCCLMSARAKAHACTTESSAQLARGVHCASPTEELPSGKTVRALRCSLPMSRTLTNNGRVRVGRHTARWPGGPWSGRTGHRRVGLPWT